MYPFPWGASTAFSQGLRFSRRLDHTALQLIIFD